MNGGVPNQMLGKFDNSGLVYGNIPGGSIVNNKWYLIEAHFKTSSPESFQIWMDNTQIINASPPGDNTADYLLFGMINIGNSAPFNLSQWVDGFAVSTSRVYPASKIEIANSSTYASATKVYQEPVFLSDGSVQTKVNLTGLGSGPYYLFVTNNRNETSSAYSLSVSGDTTLPVVTSFNAPTTSSSLTISGITMTATDNVAVTGYLINESATKPAASAVNGVSVPTSYTTGSNGTKTLYAWARDAAGNVSNSMSDTVTVNVADTTPPTVTINTPTASQVITCTDTSSPYTQAVTISATTNENANCRYADASDDTWASSTVMAGGGGTSHTYTVTQACNVAPYFAGVICQDTSALTNESAMAQRTYSIGAPASDTTPPDSVTITAPSGTQPITISGASVTYTATAHDAVGIAGIRFYRNGTLLATDTTSPYSITMDTTGIADGNYALNVEAYDAAGNSTYSSNTIVYVNNTPPPPSVLFSEAFDNSSLSARGWYDETTGTGGSKISTTTMHDGAGAYQCEFRQGFANCTSGDPRRHLFTDTDSVYVYFWQYLSNTWVGSQKTYHPHMIMIMTNLNGAWDGLAITGMTAYIEMNGNKPRLVFQDGSNINTTGFPGSINNTRNGGLCGSSENRAFAGCNGICNNDTWDLFSCYDYTGTGIYTNGLPITSSIQLSLGAWHLIEVELKMNTISGSVGQNNGTAKMWIDGVQTINYTDLIYRTNQHPTMKWNQLVIAPYMLGDGVNSPVTQSFYIDTLTVGTARQAGDTISPTVSLTAPTTGTKSGNVLFTATASDDVGVVSVAFKVNGNTVNTQTTSGSSVSANYTWDSWTVANGGYQITAQACDAIGHCTTSSSVSITVSNTPPDTTAPKPVWTGSYGIIPCTNPIGYTATGLIAVTTNEPATCRASSGTYTWDDMWEMEVTGGTSHSHPSLIYSCSNSYSYYVKCKDSSNNITSDADMAFGQFTVAPPAGVVPTREGGKWIGGKLK
jgi:hypothetical protein